MAIDYNLLNKIETHEVILIKNKGGGGPFLA